MYKIQSDKDWQWDQIGAYRMVYNKEEIFFHQM